MDNRLSCWTKKIYLTLILLPAIPVFFAAGNSWSALILIGLMALIQCYQYAVIDNTEMDEKDVYIRNCCLAGKLIIFTCFLILTGYWYFSPLYYVIIGPVSNKEVIIALFLPLLGVPAARLPGLLDINELPMLLLSALVVLLITTLFHIAQVLVSRLAKRENLFHEHMKKAALNELKIKNLNRKLAIKYQLADINARLEERENIARNIHNVVGHTITSAIVSLQAYKVLREADPDKSDDKLAAATERMYSALEEIRRAVRVLDQDTQEISMKDFRQLLIAELQRFSMDTEIEVSHNLDYIDTEYAISKRCCEFLHSALTECLNNGIRHGHATAFSIFMQCDSNYIELSVTDNGKGFGSLSKEKQDLRISQGYGIRKMEQFALEHGGELKISSDNGFRVRIKLPLVHA